MITLFLVASCLSVRSSLMRQARVASILMVTWAYSAIAAPVATGPAYVAPGKHYIVKLMGADQLHGQWRIEWGDGNSDTISSQQSEARHVFTDRGVREVRVTFSEESGAEVPVSGDLAVPVSVGDPGMYLNFNDVGATDWVVRGEASFVPSFRPGAGQAVRLNGQTHLRITNHVEKNADFFAMDFWLRPADLNSRQVIYSGVGSSLGNVRVYIENRQLCFEMAGGGSARMPLEGVQEGRWHQFGVSYERSRYFKERSIVRLYRDGELRAETPIPAARSLPVVFSGATVGAQEVGERVLNPLKGDLDEIQFHRLGIFPGAFLQRYLTAVNRQCSWFVAVGADGSDSFVVDEPVIAREVRVELDPAPDVDCLPLLQAAVDRAEPGTKLILVNRKTGVSGGLFYLNSRDPNWRLLVISGKTDLEIDGGGAGFVVRHSATKYVTMTGCTRVALRNLSFDIDQTRDRPSVYARIEKIEPLAGRLQVQYVQGNPLRPDVVPAGMHHWRWRGVDGTTRELDRRGFLPIKIKSRTVSPTDGSRWLFTLSNPRSDRVWDSLAKLSASRGLLQVNNAHFGGSGVNLYGGCRHVTFDRVNFYGVMGMVFLTSDFDYLRVSRCIVGLPPGMSAEDRPFAAASDAFHFHSADGGHVIFEYNDVAMVDDDPVSIKDGVYRNVAKRGTRDLEVSGKELRVGSSVELRTTDLEPMFSATIVASDAVTKTIRLDRDVPGDLGQTYHLMNLSRRTNHWVLRGNRIHGLNGRMMLYTGDGTVVGNRFEGVMVHLGFSAADFDNAGRARDIVLQENFVIDGPGDTGVWGAKPTLPVFEDIALISNSLLRSQWKFNHVDQLSVLNNHFRPAAEIPGAIVKVLNHSRNVELRNNHIRGAKTNRLAEVDETSTAKERGTTTQP